MSAGFRNSGIPQHQDTTYTAPNRSAGALRSRSLVSVPPSLRPHRGSLGVLRPSTEIFQGYAPTINVRSATLAVSAAAAAAAGSSLRRTKQRIRQTSSLQGLLAVLKGLPKDQDKTALLVPVAVHELGMLIKEGHEAAHGSHEQSQHARGVLRGFLRDDLPRWLAMSPPPAHLAVALAALALLDWRPSKEVKAALTALMSEPTYLWRAAKQPTAYIVQQAGAAHEVALTQGNLLPPLVAILEGLGMPRKSLGDGLRAKRLRELLWPKGDSARLLAQYLILLHGSLSRAPEPTKSLKAKVSASTEDRAKLLGGRKEPPPLQPNAAEPDATEPDGLTEEQMQSRALREARFQAHARFLFDLRFLNRHLVSAGIEVTTGLLAHPHIITAVRSDTHAFHLVLFCLHLHLIVQCMRSRCSPSLSPLVGWISRWIPL